LSTSFKLFSNALRKYISDSSLHDLYNNNNTKELLFHEYITNIDIFRTNAALDERGVVARRLSATATPFDIWYPQLGNCPMDQHMQEFPVISEWLKLQPLSILQLDAADRIVLFIAGMSAPITSYYSHLKQY
jgi:hypothetical protein